MVARGRLGLSPGEFAGDQNCFEPRWWVVNAGRMAIRQESRCGDWVGVSHAILTAHLPDIKEFDQSSIDFVRRGGRNARNSSNRLAMQAMIFDQQTPSQCF